MTVATVKTVATRFLTSATPEVLVLKGAWGVGKTFAWNNLVQQHRDEIKLANYCYVSLFGISSISQLRTAIFAKTQPVKLYGQKLDAKIINDQWGGILSAQVKRLFQSGSNVIKELPYGKNVTVSLETIAPYFIRNAIICLDDFERLNPDCIKPDELLGFISELKEEKECKVVLIFNEDELNAKDIYKKYREKIVDIELLYAPTAEEAAEIAFPVDLPSRDVVKKYAVLLGIKNIRILRKIVTLTKMIHREVDVLHAGVMEQAIMTLVLLVWCYYGSDEKKPTFNFVIEWNGMLWSYNENKGKEEKDPKHSVWAKTLQDYGLMHIDEFDLALSKVIEHGYLEETGFSEEAIKLDAKIRANELEQSFTAAWKIFHNTFSDNQAELVQSMFESFKKSVRHISPLNLNGTTMLLRQLGRGDISDELIDYYIEARSDEDKLFNLADNPFSSEIRDPAIWERFNNKYAKKHLVLPLIDAVNHIATSKRWSNEHIQALEQATEDDFYNLFKMEHGDALGNIVKSCLQFEEWEDHRKTIGQVARAALVRIGKENLLNAIRVKRYGIAIEHSTGPSAPATE